MGCVTVYMCGCVFEGCVCVVGGGVFGECVCVCTQAHTHMSIDAFNGCSFYL